MTYHVVCIDDRPHAARDWRLALDRHNQQRINSGLLARDWVVHQVLGRSVDAVLAGYKATLNELYKQRHANPENTDTGPLITVLMVDGVITLNGGAVQPLDGWTVLYPQLVRNGIHWHGEAFVSQYGRPAQPEQSAARDQAALAVEAARAADGSFPREFFAVAQPEFDRFAAWANSIV